MRLYNRFTSPQYDESKQTAYTQRSPAVLSLLLISLLCCTDEKKWSWSLLAHLNPESNRKHFYKESNVAVNVLLKETPARRNLHMVFIIIFKSLEEKKEWSLKSAVIRTEITITKHTR